TGVRGGRDPPRRARRACPSERRGAPLRGRRRAIGTWAGQPHSPRALRRSRGARGVTRPAARRDQAFALIRRAVPPGSASTAARACTFGEAAPLRQIRTVLARFSPAGSACTERRRLSGNVESTLLGS